MSTTRRVITRICIGVSFASLAAVVIFPPLRHHAPLGGAGIAANAAVSILAGLAYLRSKRDVR
jgi:hypothetical protein